MSLDPRDVDDILAVLDSLKVDEFRLRTSRFALTLRRAEQGWTRTDEVLATPQLLATVPAERAEPAGPTPTGGSTADPAPGLHAVRARLMGTFYRAPRPGADPFVQNGDRVLPETVIGIVETMKLMNSVPAGVAGTIRDLPIGDAEFVERDAVLVLIEPDEQA